MIVLYARVSTAEQTTEHQLTQATQAGFEIDKVVADDGVSGVAQDLPSAPKAAGCTTCSGLEIRSWCVGSIGLAATKLMFATLSASS